MIFEAWTIFKIKWILLLLFYCLSYVKEMIFEAWNHFEN